jgi:hypothetical protein
VAPVDRGHVAGRLAGVLLGRPEGLGRGLLVAGHLLLEERWQDDRSGVVLGDRTERLQLCP